MSLCSDNRLSESIQLLNTKGSVQANSDNSERRVPGAGVGASEKIGSSNQPRQTQRQEKRSPSPLMFGNMPRW